jgi:diaminopimelate epimerase
MKIDFLKYQGAGNDFVMIDNRNLFFPKEDKGLIHQLCDRKFGIGADGLILLENHEKFDFKMVYFNADGSESTMCGNGGRCIVALAKELQIIESKACFSAIDGIHEAEILENGWVKLGMIDVHQIETLSPNEFFLNTGSPHYVKVVDEMPVSIVEEARKVRYNERFSKEGVNVNFILIEGEKVHIRTYERGVEDETLACGTGSVAAAMVASIFENKQKFDIQTLGGELAVAFKSNYTHVFLEGPALKVFDGQIDVDKELKIKA